MLRAQLRAALRQCLVHLHVALPDLVFLPWRRRVGGQALGTVVAAQEELPLVLLSFMSESRRLDNTRLKRELRVRLRHATVDSGLRA